MREEKDYDNDDEDDYSELEFVSPTNTTGDAWTSGTSLIHVKDRSCQRRQKIQQWKRIKKRRLMMQI